MTADSAAEQQGVQQLLDAIVEHHGYDLRGYATDHLTRRIRTAMQRRKATHPLELLQPTLNDPRRFTELLDDLTVQVSELFRDPHLYETVRREVLPLLRTYPHVKIWHAGCASGEESYSMAILLHEEQMQDRCQLYGTDLSSTAVMRAQQATFREADFERSARNYSAAGGRQQLERYCTFGYGHFTIRQFLREHVVFFQHNLAADYSLGEMQVIFCRNVLLYFGEALRERVLDLFAASLCHRGFLCLGSSERIPASRSHVFEEFDARARVYRLRKRT